MEKAPAVVSNPEAFVTSLTLSMTSHMTVTDFAKLRGLSMS